MIKESEFRFTVELLSTNVIKLLCLNQKITLNEGGEIFYKSKTYKLLCDKNTGLYGESKHYIEDELYLELGIQRNVAKTNTENIEKMKQFMLFAYSNYYPKGGLDDLVLRFDNEKELKDYITNANKSYDMYQVADVYTADRQSKYMGEDSCRLSEFKINTLMSVFSKFIEEHKIRNEEETSL